jgi:hypothetical protein
VSGKHGILEENMGTTKDKRINRSSEASLKKRKAKKKRNRRRAVRYVLIFFALVYLPAMWKWIFHGHIETDVLHSDTLEIAVKSEGVFIWDETCVKSPKDGIVIPKAKQGERVPNKFDFAIIVDRDSKRILSEIENLEKNIIRQFAENNPEVLEPDDEFKNQVQNEVSKLTDIAVNRNFTAIDEIRATLENLLYQRNRKIFENTGDRLYVEDKKRELEILRQKLNESAVTVKSEYSGIVVWGGTSDEEKYSPDNMKNLQIEDLETNNENDEAGTLKMRYEQFFDVSADQIFARLVNNDKGWYVCAINKKDSDKLKTGDEISLRVDGVKELIPCTVEAVDAFENKSRVIVSFDRYIEKVVQMRHVKADLVIENVEGLKIPLRSLINRNIYDNTADVFVVRANRAVRKRVKIIAEQDSFAIIDKLSESTDTSPIKIFDIYVVNPQNIEEGQVIN